MRKNSLTKMFALPVIGLTIILIAWNNVDDSKANYGRLHTYTCSTKNNLIIASQELENKNLESIVCVKFQGRLGNLMFQFAFLHVIAKVKHLYPVVPENLELFKIFDIEKTTISAITKPLKVCSTLPKYQERGSISFDVNVLAVPPNKSVRYDGYFQSWKYWIGYEDEIRNLFLFKESIRQKAHVQIRDIINKMKFEINNDSLIVSIHIRRGDYTDKFYYKYGQLTPNETYYRNAMEYFKTRHKNVLFVVGSSDIDWSRKALAKEKNVYFSTGNSPAEDIALLSLANHTIISIGTYVWWIGWMARGKCIFYKNAMRPGSDFAKNALTHSLNDFIYPEWIPIE